MFDLNSIQDVRKLINAVKSLYQDFLAEIFIKNRLQHSFFAEKFDKFLRTLILQNISSGWLRLKYFVRTS